MKQAYVLEDIVSLYYRTTCWMFTKLSRDEVLMARTCVLTFDQICSGVDPK